MVLALGAGVAAVALGRHLSRASRGHRTAGGILISDVGGYAAMTGLLLGGLYDSIAGDVAAVAGPGAKALEVGCGPGHLSMRLAREHGLGVTGLDLDPAMIERAQRRVSRAAGGSPKGEFAVAHAASKPFGEGALDAGVRTPGETEAEIEALREVIVSLWETEETRHARPTVLDEVRGGGSAGRISGPGT